MFTGRLIGVDRRMNLLISADEPRGGPADISIRARGVLYLEVL